MEMTDLKVGLLMPGEFRRLAPHVGALEALFQLSREGLFPRPTRIVGGSAGAIIATALSPWTQAQFTHVHRVIRELRSGQIFSIPLETKMSFVLAAGSLSFPLLNHLEPQMRRSLRIGLHVAQTLSGLALGTWAGRNIFKTASLLDNTPLQRLLERSYDFRAIKSSAIEVRIMATDIETGEHIAFSTKDPTLDLKGLVMRAIASSTLPVHFPLRRVGDRILTDAEVKTNFPIAQLEDMDVVFVLNYSVGLGAHPMPRTWGDHYNGMWDIAKAENNRLVRREYEQRRRENPSLPEAVFITTKRRIPPLMLHDFNQESLERSMRLGYEIIEENLDTIGNALGRALECRETVSLPDA